MSKPEIKTSKNGHLVVKNLKKNEKMKLVNNIKNKIAKFDLKLKNVRVDLTTDLQ